MTPRSPSRNLIQAEEFCDSLELIDWTTDSLGCKNDFGDDVQPGTGVSLLRDHRLGDDHDSAEQDREARSGLLQQVITFMSTKALLGGSSAAEGSTSYGALLRRAPGSSSETFLSNVSETAANDVRKRDTRKDTNVDRVTSSASFGSKRRRNHGASHSKNRVRRASLGSSSSMLTAESGHPAGQGGHIGGRLPLFTSNDEDEDDEVISIDDDGRPDPSDNLLDPQVRASVAATDDTSASINTPRMWILSLLCAFLGSATNLFFSLRYPSVAITPVIALVVVHPLGRLWDRSLKRTNDPAEVFEDGVLIQRAKAQSSTASFSSGQRFRLWLAQGNWNGKEHACVYISSNVSFGFAFATDVIVEQSKFYGQDPSIIYQLLLTISTQILGYSFAGLTRRYLVRPPSMIWPGTLMSTAMFTTMHSSENKSANGWLISRWKFFLLVWTGAFAWYFLPGLLMPALSYFSIVTWFAPKNVVVSNLVYHPTFDIQPVADEPSSASRLA